MLFLSFPQPQDSVFMWNDWFPWGGVQALECHSLIPQYLRAASKELQGPLKYSLKSLPGVDWDTSSLLRYCVSLLPLSVYLSLCFSPLVKTVSKTDNAVFPPLCLWRLGTLGWGRDSRHTFPVLVCESLGEFPSKAAFLRVWLGQSMIRERGRVWARQAESSVVGLTSILTVSPTGDGGRGECSREPGVQHGSCLFSIPHSLLLAPPPLLSSY